MLTCPKQNSQFISQTSFHSFLSHKYNPPNCLRPKLKLLFYSSLEIYTYLLCPVNIKFPFSTFSRITFFLPQWYFKSINYDTTCHCHLKLFNVFPLHKDNSKLFSLAHPYLASVSSLCMKVAFTHCFPTTLVLYFLKHVKLLSTLKSLY